MVKTGNLEIILMTLNPKVIISAVVQLAKFDLQTLQVLSYQN